MNTGVLLENRKPEDYVYGGPVQATVFRVVTDWNSSLPDGEWQRSNYRDFLDCVTMSAVHDIESQINYDISQGKYKQEALDYFQSAGYMENGKFSASVRYSAKRNGTTHDGQYLSKAGNGLRHDGILPNKDWPIDPSMSWEEYYKEIPQELIDKALKIYDYMELPEYHWVDPYNIPSALLNAPVQVLIAMCDGWEANTTVKACAAAASHCVLAYAEDDNGYQVLDHYVPFKKILASNYHIYGAMQYVVRPKIPPNMWNKFITFLKTVT